jgi:hypothetical protein
MTNNNNMWDCRDMPPMFSAKWNIDDSSVFYIFFVNFWYFSVYLQGGLKLQARTLAVLPHSLVGHSMTYGVTKILKRIRHLK